jgi:hypothetical protein
MPLHHRDATKVGHAGGMIQVIPVGIFQPAGPEPGNVPDSSRASPTAYTARPWYGATVEQRRRGHRKCPSGHLCGRYYSNYGPLR